MEKSNKLLLFLVITILLFTPCYAIAAPDNLEENNLTNENGSSQENNSNEENGSSQENNSNEENGSSEENNENGENTSTETTPVEDEKNPLENVEITLNQKELELKTNTEVSLTATITPNDNNLEIEWSSSDESIATVDSNGKVTTKNRAATVTITATIKNSNDKKASCTIKVTRPVGKDATLKNLTISNGSLDKTFKPNVYEYSVTVDSKTNSLIFRNLKEELNDSYAGYMVTGNDKLKDGDVVSILVTAEDKVTTNTYKLTIVKDTISLNLKSLKINGYALNEVFDKEKLKYTASIPYEIEIVTIQAVAEDSEVSVKVSGNTNLKVGENNINIIVEDKSGNSRNYQIIVTREKEVTVEEKPTSIITSDNTSTSHSNSDSSSIIVTNNNGDDDSFLKYAIVSFACLILFAIGGIGIYFYLKTSPKKLKKELNDINQPEEVSPIIEVTNESKNQINIEQMMQEDLVKTKEFSQADLEGVVKTESLFDNDEDV